MNSKKFIGSTAILGTILVGSLLYTTGENANAVMRGPKVNVNVNPGPSKTNFLLYSRFLGGTNDIGNPQNTPSVLSNNSIKYKYYKNSLKIRKQTQPKTSTQDQKGIHTSTSGLKGPQVATPQIKGGKGEKPVLSGTGARAKTGAVGTVELKGIKGDVKEKPVIRTSSTGKKSEVATGKDIKGIATTSGVQEKPVVNSKFVVTPVKEDVDSKDADNVQTQPKLDATPVKQDIDIDSDDDDFGQLKTILAGNFNNDPGVRRSISHARRRKFKLPIVPGLRPIREMNENIDEVTSTGATTGKGILPSYTQATGGKKQTSTPTASVTGESVGTGLSPRRAKTADGKGDLPSYARATQSSLAKQGAKSSTSTGSTGKGDEKPTFRVYSSLRKDGDDKSNKPVITRRISMLGTKGTQKDPRK